MKHNNQPENDIVHSTLSVIFIVALTVLTIWILRPFLSALVWAGLIVIATWPLFLNLERKLGGKRRLAVTLMALAALVLLLVPLTMAVVMVFSRADDIPAMLKSLDFSVLSAPPDWLKRIPFAGDKLVEKWTTFTSLSHETRFEKLAPYARATFQWFVGKAGSLGLILVDALLTFIFSVVLYAKGDAVRTGVLRFSRRLAGRHGEEAALLAAKAARGVVLGVVGTALVQASIGTVALLIARVPATAILVAVMFLLCLAQLGPVLVLLPVTIWLFWSGHPVVGTVVSIVSVVAVVIDNIIRPLLIRKGVELPLLLIFAGVIGGLIAFGVIGIFIGPVLLAVSKTLLNDWILANDGAERNI